MTDSDKKLDAIREGAADAIWEMIARNRDISFFDAIESGTKEAVTDWLNNHTTQILDRITAHTHTPDHQAPGISAGNGHICTACQTDNSFSVFNADGVCGSCRAIWVDNP